MRKIRGFKLGLRIKDIQRRAKKAGVDLKGLGLDTDDALTMLIDQFSCRARPSVLYESFPAEGAKAPPPENGLSATALSPMPGLAYTLTLTTLGPNLDSYIEERFLSFPGLNPVFNLLTQAALDDAARFVLALVEEEAREERCELSPLQYATEPAVLQTIIAKLAGHKIGVTASESGLKPARTVAFSLSWVARSKSRAK